jgi:YidC/Oxa1 family membrane protein insertase
MSSWFGVPLGAAYHLVFELVTALTPLFGGLAAVAGIVLFTLAVRLLLLPLSFAAMRGLDAKARLAPQVQALRQQHSSHPERLQRELTTLYAAEGTSMAAGCLPVLLQWPFLSLMYLLFRSATVDGGPNALLTHSLLAVPLGSHWLAGAGLIGTLFSIHGAVFAGLFILIGVIGLATARVARRRSATPLATSTLATSLMPLLTVVFAAFLPLAGSIYLVTTTAWTLAERLIFSRPKPALR